MADEDISLTEDQLLENLDENNGDGDFNEVRICLTYRCLYNSNGIFFANRLFGTENFHSKWLGNEY